MNTAGKKRVWFWTQANGQSFKVVSNAEKGYIIVYNQNNEIVLEHHNLSPEQVKLIEKQFLTIVTSQPIKQNTPRPQSFDPMVG